MKINATVCDDEGEVHEGEAADNFEIAREGGIYHMYNFITPFPGGPISIIFLLDSSSNISFAFELARIVLGPEGRKFYQGGT